MLGPAAVGVAEVVVEVAAAVAAVVAAGGFGTSNSLVLGEPMDCSSSTLHSSECNPPATRGVCHLDSTG